MIEELKQILKLYPNSKIEEGEIYNEIRNPNFRLLIHNGTIKKYTLFLDSVEADDFNKILELIKSIKECK